MGTLDVLNFPPLIFDEELIFGLLKEGYSGLATLATLVVKVENGLIDPFVKWSKSSMFNVNVRMDDKRIDVFHAKCAAFPVQVMHDG